MAQFRIRQLYAGRLIPLSGAASVALMVGCTPMEERMGPSEYVHYDAGPYLEMSCEQLNARYVELREADQQAATGGDPYWFNDPFHKPDNEALADIRGESITVQNVMNEKGCEFQPLTGLFGL